MPKFKFNVPKECKCVYHIASKHIDLEQNIMKPGIYDCPNCGSKTKVFTNIYVSENMPSNWLPGFFEALEKS
jgi:hypothetical protein